jgi:hypothetical protein
VPYRTGLVYRDGTPVSYDPADYVASFDRLLADFDYPEWRRRRSRPPGRAAGRVGRGLRAGHRGGPFERGRAHRLGGTVRLHRVSSQGQSHETTMAQIGTELGVDPDRCS